MKLPVEASVIQTRHANLSVLLLSCELGPQVLFLFWLQEVCLTL